MRQLSKVVWWELGGALMLQGVAEIAACQTWAAICPYDEILPLSGKYLNGNFNGRVAQPACEWAELTNAFGTADVPTVLATDDDKAEEVYRFAETYV